jgi:hypothetical protein
MPTSPTAPAGVRTGRPGLLARAIGIVFSPRETFEHIAADPRWLGALLLIVGLMGAIGFVFMSTEVGQEAVLSKQLDSMEAWGMQITPELESQMEAGMARARYFSLFNGLFWAIVLLAEAGLIFVVFNAALGGTASFRQVFAVTVFASFIMLLQQLFSTPIAYARGSLDGATNAAVLLPMVDETGFVGRLLGAIDLFWIWWTVVLATGVAVLYRRRTEGILTAFAAIYAAVAVGIAAFLSMRAGS